MTSPYHDHQTVLSEQRLLQSLYDEAIYTHGEEVLYIPRRRGAQDDLRLEDARESYDSFYRIDMYLVSSEDFGGDREFMSKFAGVEIRDRTTWSVSKRVFDEVVQTPEGTIRPLEGDLIFWPQNGHLFKVTHADKRAHFFQLGDTYDWELTTEQFAYSGEVLRTGIPEVDRLYREVTLDLVYRALKNVDGTPILNTDESYLLLDTSKDEVREMDPSADNENIDEALTYPDGEGSVLDFEVDDPYSERNVE